MDNFVLPSPVKAMLAQRPRRLHHFIWHSVRNDWNSFPQSLRKTLTDKGWAPPRPAFDAAGNLDMANDSGEDFLFMHREMIAHTNAALKAAADPHYQEVVGWQTVPLPGDAEFPVPPVYVRGQVDTAEVKSDAHFFRQPNAPGESGGMQWWDQRLSNPATLKNLTLGRLGSLLEFTIHNDMHMRWSRDPGAIRPDVRPDLTQSIDPKWDALAYDWLGDTYSSHTDNHFWKLHGLIDQRIDQWAAAHNIATITWKGTWLGKMPPSPQGPAPAGAPRPNLFAALEALGTSGAGPAIAAPHGHGHDHDHGEGHVAEMEEIANLIQDCGVHYHFYDDHSSALPGELLAVIEESMQAPTESRH